MKMMGSVLYCFFLGIGIAKAQIEKVCPDPQPLGYAWKNGGTEKIHFILNNKMQLNLDEGAYYFPDLRLQVNSYINTHGHLICEYRNVVSEPLFAISMGKQKIENVKK
jgi:hypothetical protein